MGGSKRISRSATSRPSVKRAMRSCTKRSFLQSVPSETAVTGVSRPPSFWTHNVESSLQQKRGQKEEKDGGQEQGRHDLLDNYDHSILSLLENLSVPGAPTDYVLPSSLSFSELSGEPFSSPPRPTCSIESWCIGLGYNVPPTIAMGLHFSCLGRDQGERSCTDAYQDMLAVVEDVRDTEEILRLQDIYETQLSVFHQVS